jgi:hypothetical protein
MQSQEVLTRVDAKINSSRMVNGSVNVDANSNGANIVKLATASNMALHQMTEKLNPVVCTDNNTHGLKLTGSGAVGRHAFPMHAEVADFEYDVGGTSYLLSTTSEHKTLDDKVQAMGHVHSDFDFDEYYFASGHPPLTFAITNLSPCPRELCVLGNVHSSSHSCAEVPEIFESQS